MAYQSLSGVIEMAWWPWRYATKDAVALRRYYTVRSVLESSSLLENHKYIFGNED
jgi:hypothetical protein